MGLKTGLVVVHTFYVAPAEETNCSVESTFATGAHRRCRDSTGRRRHTRRSREMALPSTDTRRRRWRHAYRSGRAPHPTLRSPHTSTYGGGLGRRSGSEHACSLAAHPEETYYFGRETLCLPETLRLAAYPTEIDQASMFYLSNWVR